MSVGVSVAVAVAVSVGSGPRHLGASQKLLLEKMPPPFWQAVDPIWLQLLDGTPSQQSPKH